MGFCPKIKSFAMPLIFLGVLLFSLFFADFISINIKSFLYSVSLSIKNILIFCLPFIIFFLVFSSISKLGAKALRYIAIIIPLICCSNFLNTMLSYLSSVNLLNFDLNTLKSESGRALNPCFVLELKNIISNDFSLLFGVLSGLISGIFAPNLTSKISEHFDEFTKIFFKFLIPVMPFFVMGTVLKLEHDGILQSIFKQYFPVLIVFLITAYGTVFMELILVSKFNFPKLGFYLKNISPAVITAFGAMSSAAALPLSIKAAEKNLKDKNNAGIIVPATVNIHLVGDCFFIPMIALAAMKSFGLMEPTFDQYLIFALHFILAKFAVAAIPGGGVLVMLPVMQNYLGLSSDMLALVTALYILFDPLITMCNVLGNGTLAIIFEKIIALFSNKA